MSSDEPQEAIEEGTLPEPPGDGGATDDKPGRYLVLGTAALAAAALIVAGIFGVQWWVASADDNLALAQARDDVVQQGGAAVRAYLSTDYTNPDAYFAGIRAVSTQDMTDQVTATEQNFRKAIADAQTRSTPTVLDVGVEELDLHGGKASFLAAISYLVSVQGGPPTAKPLRLEVQMTRVGDAWKLSGIGSVPLVSGQ